MERWECVVAGSGLGTERHPGVWAACGCWKEQSLKVTGWAWHPGTPPSLDLTSIAPLYSAGVSLGPTWHRTGHSHIY